MLALDMWRFTTCCWKVLGRSGSGQWPDLLHFIYLEHGRCLPCFLAKLVRFEVMFQYSISLGHSSQKKFDLFLILSFNMYILFLLSFHQYCMPVVKEKGYSWNNSAVKLSHFVNNFLDSIRNQHVNDQWSLISDRSWFCEKFLLQFFWIHSLMIDCV